MRMVTIVLAIGVVLIALAGCGGSMSLSAGSNYKTSGFAAMWSPDPNGGIGVRMVTDSLVPDETNDNIAVGPQINFYLNDLAGMAANTVLPGDWDPLQTAPVRVYGTLSFLWETDNGKFTFLPGTEFRLFPDRPIHPAIWLEYLMPEAGAGLDEGLLTTFGAMWHF